MEVAELLAHLSKGGGASALPLATNSNAVNYPTVVREDFVAPSLSERDDAPPGQPPRVLVVSAPGAVGKTTLAREIARLNGGLYWDLALSGPVGQNSLAGMLLQGFGPTAVAAAYRALAQGQFLLVIDALDEARVKVNEASFLAFLDDIARLGSQASPGSILLFARTQHAETAWLALQVAKIPTALLTIDMFDRPKAEQYVERRVARLGPAAKRAIVTHERQFRGARDLIFDQVERAAQSGPAKENEASGRDFLGYAPVLDAVSVLLGTDLNFGALRARMEAAEQEASRPGSGSPVALLVRIVHGILDRERTGKVQPAIRPPLTALASQLGWSSWAKLYSDREQCLRLIALTTGTPSGAGDFVEEALPSALATAYEQQVRPFLGEHPLLVDGSRPASVVFEAYLDAYGLIHAPSPLRAAVENRLSSREYKPSRLLADFYLAMAPVHSGRPLVLAEHVGYLYDSVLAGESADVNIRLLVDGADPEDDVEAGADRADAEFVFYSLPRANDEEHEPVPREFVVATPRGGILRFGRYLRDASITVPCSVELGAGSSEFAIGPNVAIRAATLGVACESLVVGGGPPRGEGGQKDLGRDASVTLESLSYAGTLAQRPVVHSALQVSWPGATVFPWSDYVGSEGARAFASDPRLAIAYRRFRRIVMTLRSHSKGSLARYRGKIEHRRVLQGKVGEAMLARLRDGDVLRLSGDFYHWIPEQAARNVGVSWLDLRHGVTSETLTTYLRAFVAANAPLF